MKEHKVSVRLSEDQYKALQDIIADQKAKTQSAAIQYLINQYLILGK
ncbi:TPA: hypothetical protein OUE92_003334 [Serratia marcescens]|nr:hypothetical protein [Serratia marcescens]